MNTNRNLRFILPAAALLLAACAGLKWSGSPQIPPAESPAAKSQISGTPAAARRAPVLVPEASRERREAALFYSDLGPDAVDVSEYPTQQKHNYAIYKRACSQCHTLARSINAPYVTKAWWEFYVMSMRARAKWHGVPLTKYEVRAVLDFLEYDSNERKAGHAAQFEETKFELKRRFEAAQDERMDRLQKNAPDLSR